MFGFLENIASSSFEENDRDLIDKLKVFKPKIVEGFWGTNTTWEERETPLTDEEVKLIYKNLK